MSPIAKPVSDSPCDLDYPIAYDHDLSDQGLS